MGKKSIMAIIALIGLSSFVVLGNSSDFVSKILETVKNNPIANVFSSSSQNESEKSSLRNGEHSERLLAPESTVPEEPVIPDYVLYESVFRMVIMFNEHAKLQEAKGEAVTEFRSYFKNEAKLTSQEDDLLTQTANNYAQDIKVIDAQAEIIIEQLRQQYPAGSISEDQLIQPTPELLQVQEQRNNLALHYKDQLRDLLGDDKFIVFDKFIQGRFASGFRAMPLSSIPNNQDQGGGK